MEEVKKQGMESLFVPYEIALALKELGFDEPCMGYRDGGGFLMIKEMPHCVISAPTYQQAFRWFRQKYDLYSQTPSTCVEENDRIFYNNPIYDELDNIVFDSMEQYTTHEEAELECLKKLIEIVKQK
jgi:hypothetical protein